jgi:multidrug efflux system outer membrane protein
VKLSFSRVTAFAMVLVLSACAMGPDYERPEVPVPDAFLEPTIPGASIANLKWWKLFQDEELTRLIETALINNKEVAIAMARIEEARAALGFARADQFPNLDGAAGATRGNLVPGTGLPGSINESFVLAGSLSFEVDLWGKLRRSTEAARAELLATVEARNVVTITLIADVASVYLLLLDLDHRVSIAQRTMETRQNSLGIIQARFDKGTVALIDVNQAQIELADAAAELASLERENQKAENLFNVLLGQNPGSIERTQSREEKIFPPEIPAGLPSELLERRPDVRQASQQLAAQTARIGVAEALRFPSLSLTGTLGLASTELDDFFSSSNKAWGLSANFLGPVFDAGRNKSRVEAERARTEQLLKNYELIVLRAFQEVEDSLIDISTYRDEALARQNQVTAARSASELSSARYNGGVTSYLEVLESDRSLFRAELLASSTKRLQLVSIISLYKALGGGWLTDEEAAAAAEAQTASTPSVQ